MRKKHRTKTDETTIGQPEADVLADDKFSCHWILLIANDVQHRNCAVSTESVQMCLNCEGISR